MLNEQGETVFTITRDDTEQIRAFTDEHDKTCPHPRCYAFFTPTSKYKYEFRPTGIGPDLKIICDCGESFAVINDL